MAKIEDKIVFDDSLLGQIKVGSAYEKVEVAIYLRGINEGDYDIDTLLDTLVDDNLQEGIEDYAGQVRRVEEFVDSFEDQTAEDIKTRIVTETIAHYERDNGRKPFDVNINSLKLDLELKQITMYKDTLFLDYVSPENFPDYGMTVEFDKDLSAAKIHIDEKFADDF
ncbi:MAG: hypothetical protein LBL90_03190 [Prevotellaceae bacterium]|jgi:hypothetical protein|nr:hypothetical protein [Prevotellaceae bacterium]